MYVNRIEAAHELAKKIHPESDAVILAIPRGGIVIGDILAEKLGCILDVVISKKITPPNYPEYAIGAITHDGTLYKSEYWSKFCNEPGFEHELVKKQSEVKRRLEEYRGHDFYELENKPVILVDDGVATGSTVFAILNWIKKQSPKKITLAIPVISPNTYEKMKNQVDEMVVLKIPDNFSAVGQFYDDFSQISDSQVNKILNKYH
ncbi:hypothetical protein NsoK4_04555 [Nitrosopumilus sp. K4]|uniref:phosphoribosyltransferase n=1 Tax=Nitrosopumilus sp. K4 TaxID=2795383 RepID=UPI001BA470A5|nr:phosphoribosyltransferase family protein [Nitrosopumilus sp. K4]QUC65512.1 hypothetical protein NsoK4_04555 [Nitrosopumilus sp. K4]